MERIARNFLEIKSLNNLLKVNKPIHNVEINLLIPPDFQLNKFLYKEVILFLEGLNFIKFNK